ncbi:MAG TPA: thioredoxin family protein [Anaerolineae bacterium]|nr:thioredoxin family protein [Anaerolineae bacterium]
MLSIKVLGPGCENCERVELHAIQAVEQWKEDHPEVEVTIEKVTEIENFLDYDLLSTPGLVINEKLVSSGKIPAPSHIIAWLDEAVAGLHFR